MPQLTSDLVANLPRNGPTDPIEYYRRPIVGYLYRERINMGFRLLGDRHFDRVLEVGFGAGAVLLALAPAAGSLFGIDLDADPKVVGTLLEGRGIRADLRKGNVYELPFEEGLFDLVVSYSVFEHLHDYRRALGEVARVLRPDGLFLLGMPAVNKAMTWGFRAIGFNGIDDHHVTTPREVERAFGDANFSVLREDVLGLQAVRRAALYYTWLLKKGTSPGDARRP
jgi:SAM-dependent methyltransferase